MDIKRINTKSNLYKSKYLNYIGFIKFLAMIIIIKWHLVHQIKWSIDIGSRMCEILFISSGFLVGYNYFNSPINTSYEYSFKYTYKHLRSFYPLYLINLASSTIYNKIFFKCINKQCFSILTTIEIFLINITFLQSWSKYKVPYFNDHTWFLSDLLFLYFVSPILLKGIKTIKISIVLFILISLIRIIVEIFLRNGAINFFDTHIYYGPIIRLLEFYLGMLTIPLFFFIKHNFDNVIIYRKVLQIIYTFIQIIFPIHAYFFMLKYNKILYSCFFILYSCFFVFMMGFDYGYLSNIISHKIFKLIMCCQFEIYLLQFKVNPLFTKLEPSSNGSSRLYIELIFHLKLILIFLISYTYKTLLKEKLAKYMDKIIVLIEKLLDII